MFNNYLKLALRNLLKNKSQTLINIGGLTLGIVCALVIFLVIQYDLNYDTWHEDSDRIYRVVREDSEFGNISHDTGGPYPFAQTIEEEVSGLEVVSQVNNNYANTAIFSYQEQGITQRKFKEENFVYVEEAYFQIFHYEWLAGTPETALSAPNSLVISESFANKLFGTINVLGKEVTILTHTFTDFTVTGLVKDYPEQTDFPFVAFASHNSRNRDGNTIENDNWGSSSSSVQTYVKLLPGTSVEDVNAQFDPIIAKYRSEERAEVVEYFLQPLSEIHYDSRFGNYSGRVVEKRTLYALGIIGVFLLIAACINFINLNTAIAVKRSKEVGLRKTLGGTRPQLTLHFLGETAFVTLISIILAIGFTELVLQGIEPVLGIAPQLDFLENTNVILFLIALLITITLIAGWYPAHYLSTFNPIEAIRNKINARYGQGLLLRRSLIIVQFSITQILIIGTITIASQIQHFNQQDLGFEKEAVVQIDIPSRDKLTLETFKSTLTNQSSIHTVSFSNTGTTHGNVWGGNYVIEYDTIRAENDADVKFIDTDFLEAYGIRLLAGTNIQPSDTVNMFLVNESLAIQAGFGDNLEGLIGRELTFWGDTAPIVGVVNDFNTSSLQYELRPVVLGARSNFYVGAIKVNTAMLSQALADIEEAYDEAFPSAVFEYVFLEDHIDRMYRNEQRTASIMNIFTIIAVIIGSLGLFGLVSYMATTRVKEIGVRKVLGANILDILKIFGSELGLLTGVSFLIAAPVSYYFMQQWLQDFAYRIDIGFEIFAGALLGTVLIAALTVGYKSISAALANPIDSLKTE